MLKPTDCPLVLSAHSQQSSCVYGVACPRRNSQAGYLSIFNGCLQLAAGLRPSSNLLTPSTQWVTSRGAIRHQLTNDLQGWLDGAERRWRRVNELAARSRI